MNPDTDNSTMTFRVKLARAIVKAIIVAGVVSAILFWKMRNTTLFWVAVSCLAMVFINFWLLLMYAKRGYDGRLRQLRKNLLRMRTIEKRAGGDDSVDPIERDDVDVLIAHIHRTTFDKFPVPAWAMLCLGEIEEYQKLYESSPGVDPQLQPTWLVFLNNVFLLACVILLVIAVVIHFTS